MCYITYATTIQIIHYKEMLNLTEVKEVKTEAKTRARAKKDAPIQTEEVKVVATEKSVGLIAVDNGGDNTKVLSEDMSSPISFGSRKERGKKRDKDEDPIVDPMKTHSFIIEWNDKVYLTNNRTRLAKYNSMTGNVSAKDNEYFILSTLIAVALYGYDVNYLITSIPYEHKALKDKNDRIKELLTGQHSLWIDGETYEFEIAHVWLSIEAQAGHVYLQEEGVTTMLEIGSRTVGFATNELIFNEDGTISLDQPILEKTGTLSRKGIQITEIDDEDEEEYELYVHDVFKHLSNKITENDKIIAFGGGVLIEPIREALSKVYNNIQFAEDPLYVQVRGMLEIGRMAYTEEFGEDNE